MKASIATATGLLALFSAQASATNAPLAIEIEAGKGLAPTGVVQTRTAAGLEVSGWVKKSWPYRGRLFGHVDVEVRNRNGDAVSVQQDALFGRTPTPKNPDRARFSLTLAALPEDAVSLSIRHHVGGH
jgi:hypothetical protein